MASLSQLPCNNQESIPSSTSSSERNTPPSGSSSPPQHQLTPLSNDSDAETPRSGPGDSPVRRLRVQTNFDKLHRSVDAGAEEEEEDDGESHVLHGYNSDEELEGKYRPAGSLHHCTAEEERQVVRTFDRKLVPFLALLYLLSFLDRSNIGNARIAGLTDDLNLSSSQYEWLLTAFYITYILFEWMTLMYRLVPAHIYIPICVCGWGLAASFQSLSTSFWSMVFLRALLGITEAAFGPGVPFYLSLFYKREELAFRNGLFISAAPLASSFASSLAWLIIKLSSDGPIAPWRTLFLIEGFPSVIVAVFAWMLIPDSPGTARFLTPRLKKVAELRLGPSKIDIHEQKPFDWREVRKALIDPKSYLMAFMFFSCNVAFSSMPVFLPTIIKDMGYSPVTSQALSAPPYLFAFFIVLITAYLSDRHRCRSPFLIIHALLSSTAYLIIALTGHFHTHLPPSLHTSIRYLCVYPAISGFFASITLIITWSMDNRTAKEGKGTSIAILNIVGQCGPLLGTRLYPTSDGPWYVCGMATCSFFMVLVAILAFALRVILVRENLGVGLSFFGGSRAGAGPHQCEVGDGRGRELELEAYGHGGEREGLMGSGDGGDGGDRLVLRPGYAGARKALAYIL